MRKIICMGKQCEICAREMKVFAKGESYTYWRCDKCHWFSTSSNYVEEKFNYDEYETFDADLDNREGLVDEAKNILMYKFNLLRIWPGSFLDLGCSEGIFVQAYNELMNTKDGYGIEVAGPKIKRAQKENLKDYNYDDMPSNTFDFVLCRHVIEHIESPMEYLNYILRYVNAGGILCIETPNNENIDHLINGNTVRDDRFCRDLYPPTHVCGFAPKTFKMAADKLNLKLCKLLTYSGGDANWCYTVKGEKIALKYRICEKVYLGNNIAAFYRKK